MHKTAITPHRILEINEKANTVSFKYKDYRYRCTDAEHKEMTITIEEFIRRFAQHILPKGFTRIRHFGILSSTWKREKLGHLQQKLTQKPPPPKPEKATKVRPCPCCKTGNLQTILSFDHRGPPPNYHDLFQKLKTPACK